MPAKELTGITSTEVNPEIDQIVQLFDGGVEPCLPG